MEEQLLQAKIQILQHIWPVCPCLLGKADVRVRADSAAQEGRRSTGEPSQHLLDFKNAEKAIILFLR